MLVDSHCHLDFPDFADDMPDVMRRAQLAGVEWMMTISTRLETFPTVRAIAEAHPNVFCTVGVHPHNAGEGERATVERLIELADHPKVIGFGETGLDYFYDHSPRPDQQASFRAHIAAARQTGLPVIVHTRDAEMDTLDILGQELQDGRFKGLIHCFSASQQFAEKAIEYGFYLSFSGIVTFNKAEDLRAVAAEAPLERLLVETDAPYLSPVPKRGKRNEPAFTAFTAARIAEAKGIDVAGFNAATSANFFRLFEKAEAWRQQDRKAGAGQ